VWTGDGRSVVYVSNARGGGDEGAFDAYRVRADGGAPAELLQRHSYGLWEAELSRDERWLVVRADEAGGHGVIRARRLAGDTALVPLVAGRGTNLQFALSPDARWLAYVSNATGRRDVYVTPFPDASSSRLVSRDGGGEPRWAHSGRELFYKSGSQLMAVTVAPGPTFTPGVPRPLFSVAGYRSARNRQQYDVAPDDRRFLMIREHSGGHGGDLVYVENWFEELKARAKQN
jgi:Tol biopolymer transport system component